MAQMLHTRLDEGQIAKLIQKHEAATVDIVAPRTPNSPCRKVTVDHLLRLQCPCDICQINRTVLA